jgi:hypothetical protein
MTSHELQYCRWLLKELVDSRIEIDAMSTVLDRPVLAYAPHDWRVVVQQLAGDPVFRSAAEANQAPYLEKARLALMDKDAFAALQLSCLRNHACAR